MKTASAGTPDFFLACIHGSCFKRLGREVHEASEDGSLLQAQQAETLVLDVGGNYITLLVPGMLHDCWLESIASSCSVRHSEMRIMSQDSRGKVSELLEACPPDSVPLLLCPTLLGGPEVTIPSGSGPPYLASTKELLLQGNVTVAPSALSAPCVSASLPQPFPSNALFCKMRALVVARRRVSKRLVFVDLAPLAYAADPDALGNSRRACWQHPRTHGHTRLQMIMGDKISQLLGQQSASKLMRSVKPGCVVDCVGQPAKAAEESQSGSSLACVEFVALSVQIVAPRVVSSRGNTPPLQLIATLINPLSLNQGLQDGVVKSFAGSPALNAVAQRKRRHKPAPARPIKKFSVINNIMEVSTIDDVRRMHEDLVACLPTVTCESSYWDFVPIGMDAEWEPYARAEPATPVATLQISSRACAYVMDMQALVRSVRRNRCERTEDDAEEIPGSGEQHTRWPDTHPHLRNLTPSEQAVSDLLGDLFAAPGALKLGFAFHNDLHQLVNSFPHLPVFQSLPVRLRTPRKVHAPALHNLHQLPSLRVERQSFDDGETVKAAGRLIPVEQVPEGWACISDGEPEASDGAEPDMFSSQNEQLSRSVQGSQPCTVQRSYSVAQLNHASIVTPAAEQVLEQTSSSLASSTSNQGSEAASEMIGSFLLSSFIDCSALEALCRGRSRQAGRRESLSAVTSRLLGKSLDKREQVSSWSTRPLRRSQIEYAAGDAHVLVSICDKLVSSATEAPRAQAIWSLRSGLHLLQTMYPKPNTVDESHFVFARDRDKEIWTKWREGAWD